MLDVHADGRRSTVSRPALVVIEDTASATHATWSIIANALSRDDGFQSEVREVLDVCHEVLQDCPAGDLCPWPPQEGE